MAARLWWTCVGALATIGWTFLPWTIVRADNGEHESVDGLSGSAPHSIVCSALLVVVCGLTALACLAWLSSRRPTFAIAAAFGPPLMLMLTIINVIALANGSYAGVAVGAFLAGGTALATGVLAISSALIVRGSGTGPRGEPERMLWTGSGALATVGSLYMPWAVVSNERGYGSVHGLFDVSPASTVCSVLMMVVCGLTVLAAATWLITREPLAAFAAAWGPPLMLLLTIANASVRFAVLDHLLGPNQTSTGGGTFFAGAIAITLIILTVSTTGALSALRRPAVTPVVLKHAERRSE